MLTAAVFELLQQFYHATEIANVANAALMSRRIRAVEHRKCVAGPSGAHIGFQDRILQNYTRIENAHEVRTKTFNFYYV